MKNDVNRALVAKKKFCKVFLGLLAILLLNFAFPVQAWGSSDYKSSVTASANPSAAGTVYVNTSKSKGTSNTASQTTNTTSAPTHTYYLYADVIPGYKWDTWATGSNCNALSNATTQNGASVTVTAGTSTVKATVTAKFKEVTVNSVSGDNVLNPTSRTETYEGTVTFGTANGTAKTDFNDPSFTATSGTGTFEVTNWTFSENTATVDYTFKGNGKRGNNSGTLTFSSLSGSSLSITITANYPAITIAAGEAAEILPSTPTTPTQGTATFAVTNAGADDDFATPVISGAAAGDTWTIDSWGYADNVVTVNYTFTSNGTEGTHTATLTLSEADNGSSASNSVILSALVEEVATQDASVTDNGVTTKYNTWALALAAANASSNNPTIKLLRDVSGISASQSITKSMTIDLNRYTLSGTTDKLLNINGTGIAVTITDSKNGGTIAMTTSAVAKASTVYITKGSLTLDNATIEATNNYGTASSDARAIAVWVDVNGTFVMNSGELKGTTAQDYAYGLYSYGTTTINGGTLTATAALKSRGMCLYQGTTTINGGEINAITTSGAEAVGVYMYTGNSKYGTLTTAGGTINVSSATTTAYGIYPYYAGNTITASDLTINVVAEHTTAYGVYMPAASTTSLTNCTINVEGKGNNLTAAGDVNAMGVYAYKTGGKVTLDNTTINAQVTRPSYGRYAYGVNAVAGVTTTIQNNCSITATSDYQHAYGVKNAGSLTMTNSTATVESKNYAYAYGVNSTGATNVITGNTINVTSGTTYGYGVYIEKASSTNTINSNTINVETKATTMTTTTSTTYTYGVYLTKSGTLTMEGNTIYAECTKEGMGRYVYGARFDSGTLIATLRNNHITAVAPYDYAYGIYNCATMTSENDEALGKTITSNLAYGIAHVQTNPAYELKITGGTFTGQTMASSTSYGMFVNYGKVTATGTTFNANSYTTNPRGVWGEVSLNTYTLAKYYADITLTNCTINATSQTSSKSYGLYLNAAACENNEGTWNALSADNKTKYEATYKMGTEAVAAQATLNNCTITATSKTTDAYGIYAVSRPYQTSNLYSPGETILDVRPTLTINGGTYTGKTLGTTTAYGMYTGGNTTVTGGTFIGAPKTATGYGIYVYDGNMTANGTTIQVSGTGTLYGVYAQGALGSPNNYVAGKKYEGHADLTDVNVTVTATAANAYAVYANAATQHQDEASYNALSNDNKKTYKPENYVYGDWAAAGSATIHSGTFNVNSSSTGAYTLYSKGTVTSTNGTASATSSLIVEDGYFKSTGSSDFGEAKCATAEGMTLQGGYYVHATNLTNYCAEGYNPYALDNGDAYDAGYRYQISDQRPLGQATCQVRETVSGKTQVTPFYDLETALLYANNTTNTLTIVMLCDYILPAGNYTLPSNATLLVPWKDGQTAAKGDKVDYYKESGTPPTLKLYRTLTFAEGVNMTVNGIFEVGGRQHIYANAGCGSPCDGYAHLVMKENSSITLNNGAKLRGWGFITGKGTVDARRGSTCYEMFQIMDFRGGTCTMKMNGNNKKYFPLNQYYIQNIEVPVTYHPGSHLYAGVGAVGQQADNACLVGINGEIALFTMDDKDDSEDTWVRKAYDATNDRQTYAINSAAKLNAITIKLGSYSFNSSSYVLPVTNNMDIHLLTGTLNVTQNVSFLPGSNLEIDKEATGVLDSGKNVYFYDAQDWHDDAGKGLAYGGNNFVTVKFTPSWTTCPRTTIDNAKLNIHGTFKVNGGLYTSTSGSSIISTNEDAGTIVFTAKAPSSETKVYECNNTSPTYYDVTFTPANLRNGNNSKVSTSGTPDGKSYCYQDGEWKCLVHNGCFDIDETSNDPAEWIYYAKPGDYVALKSGTEDATTHLYYSADELRMFILMPDNCQWWEVAPYDDIYYCADNDTYYYYDAGASAWKEKEVTVTWQNWDGSKIADYQVKYNSTPKYLGSLPARAASNYYTYDFIGWSPALTDDVKVTENTVFVAQYEQKDKLYKVTFTVGGISEINYFKWGEIPYSERFLDDQPGKKLTWTPTISAVTGIVTYTGTYTDLPDDPTTLTYTVTWKNYEGTTLETDNNVAYNAMPEYNGTTPTKLGIADKDFEFDGWTPDIAPVTENVVYVAKYRDVAKKFQIRFLAEDGVTVLQTSQVAYNVVPTYTATLPTKEHADPEHYYYELVWNPLVSAVTKAQDYKATFVQKPNTMRLIVDGGTYGQVNVTVGGETFTNQDRFSEKYDYLTEATIEAVNPATGYHFVRWSDGVTTNPRTVQVTSSTPFTAVWSNKFSVTWILDGGTITSSSYTEGETVVGTPIVAPVVEKAGYDFVAWTPAVDVTMPEKDVTYTATWTPGNTTYLVEYYKLHIKDGAPFTQRYSYREYPAQTGDVVTPEPIDIEGYDTPESEPVTVAGDGSTVVRYYYQISKTNKLEVDEGNTKTITEPTEAYTVVLAPGKTMNITGTGSVTAQNLVLQSVPGDNTGANLATTSGLDILGKVCIEIDMNKSGTMDDKLYYCFSVPFAVNVADGVERLNVTNNTWSKAVLNTNYLVYTYSESDRAEKGPQDSNWTLFKGTQFAPGVFYLCAFDNSNYNRYRFYAAEGASLNNKEDIEVTRSSENEKNGGWNGVANNGLTDNKLSGDFTFIQTLNSESNSFESAEASKKPLAIGNAAMVQVSKEGSVVVGATPSAVAARRMGEAASTEFINVRLYKENQDKHVDQIFIRASEDAAEQYVAGIDLSKATMGTPKVARLWVNDYDLQLVANEALMTNDQATFSLGMSAPANGEYTIAIDDTPNDAIVYLTMNGSAIWNLNIAPAPISLSKGTENSYGLRLVHKINNVVTGLDEAVLNGNVQKVILNDHLYIIRDGKVYSAHGHVIK